MKRLVLHNSEKKLPNIKHDDALEKYGMIVSA